MISNPIYGKIKNGNQTTNQMFTIWVVHGYVDSELCWLVCHPSRKRPCQSAHPQVKSAGFSCTVPFFNSFRCHKSGWFCNFSWLRDGIFLGSSGLQLHEFVPKSLGRSSVEDPMVNSWGHPRCPRCPVGAQSALDLQLSPRIGLKLWMTWGTFDISTVEETHLTNSIWYINSSMTLFQLWMKPHLISRVKSLALHESFNESGIYFAIWHTEWSPNRSG